MNPAVIEDLCRDGRTCCMGDQLGCTYQLMARQTVDKKKYIEPTQSLPNIISRTQKTQKPDKHRHTHTHKELCASSKAYWQHVLWGLFSVVGTDRLFRIKRQILEEN